MRPSLVLLSVIHFIAFLVAAHPFVVISTDFGLAATPIPILDRRQGLLDQFESAVNSALGLHTATSSSAAKHTTQTSSSTHTAQTLVLPITTSSISTSTSDASQSTSTSSDEDDDNTATTTSDQATSTDSSSTITTTETQSPSATASTNATLTLTSESTTAQPSPTSSLVNVQPTNPVSSPEKFNDSGNNVPAAGIAVAAIMIVAVLLISVWLVFKYNTRAQAWWISRQEKKRQQRSYREALDGPVSGSSSPSKEALASDPLKRRTMLQSFFAPATAKLSHGSEIKRKPVNWGAEIPSRSDTTGNEKTSITASAAPMGTNNLGPPLTHHTVAELDSTPIPQTPPIQPVSPISLSHKESLRNLPPISPLSTHTKLPSISERQITKTLPELPPPIPILPAVLHAKRGSDGVFRLA